MQVETWSLEPVLRSDVTVYDWPNQIWTLSGGQYWGSIGLDAEYADVGRELMRLVDDVDRAVDADEREAPREALKQYQKEIAKRRRGSPRKGPRDELLRALASEGDQLLELLWLTLPSKISQRTDQLLATHKVARSDRNLWAFRLALPILSKPEIQALRDPSETGWTKRRGIKPSPTRLCTWILSRRLGMKPVSLARKTLGARASETFEGIANPVDAFTS
jgi:hypothetical protein